MKRSEKLLPCVNNIIDKYKRNFVISPTKGYIVDMTHNKNEAAIGGENHKN